MFVEYNKNKDGPRYLPFGLYLIEANLLRKQRVLQFLYKNRQTPVKDIPMINDVSEDIQQTILTYAEKEIFARHVYENMTPEDQDLFCKICEKCNLLYRLRLDKISKERKETAEMEYDIIKKQIVESNELTPKQMTLLKQHIRRFIDDGKMDMREGYELLLLLERNTK